MDYKCLNCEWSGPWDELILETMCPMCRSSAIPLSENEDPIQQVMQNAYSYMTTGASPQ